MTWLPHQPKPIWAVRNMLGDSLSAVPRSTRTPAAGPGSRRIPVPIGAFMPLRPGTGRPGKPPGR